MSYLEKFYTFIIFAAVVIGLAVGQLPTIATRAESVIVPLLMGMLYLTFLQVPFEKIKAAFANRTFTYTAVVLNFVWVPLLAWGLALLFLKDHPALYIGFIMLMVTPCTDWYLIFTGMARGNVAVSTAILPINLVLQLALLPVYLLLFGGSIAVIDPEFLFQSILMVLSIPFVFAIITNYFFKNDLKRKAKWLEKVCSTTDPVLSVGHRCYVCFTRTVTIYESISHWAYSRTDSRVFHC